MRWKPQLRLLTNVKRSKASTNYYKNSSATFRPIIQLMHDVELNPGPDVQLDIRCLYTNTRSVFNKIDELQALAVDVDIVAVTETWLKPTILSSEILPSSDFTIHRRDRAVRIDKRGGGVMLAVRNIIPSVRRTDIETSAEIVACELRPSDKKKLLFAVFYRPPGSDLAYLKEFTKFLRLASKANFENIVIAGDFNLPNIDWSNINGTTDSPMYSHFVKKIKDYFLWQVIDFPTRNNSILDLILTSIPEKISNIEGCQDILNIYRP